jgi:DNA-binding transcriptional MerR regulator
MSYTIKKLAKISGVSIRALHWDDEIGLLKPAFIMDNGYRYYKEEQLLRLQQILFFRELGFKLSDIQKLLIQNDFDNIQALKVHKDLLQEDINRKLGLIGTIYKTIQYLEGNEIMTNSNEFYKGFESKDQGKYATFLVKFRGTASEQEIAASITKAISEEEKSVIAERTVRIFNDITALMQDGYSHESSEVQAQIKLHVQILAENHEVNKAFYEKCGYSIFSTLDNFTCPGIRYFSMRKDL